MTGPSTNADFPADIESHGVHHLGAAYSDAESTKRKPKTPNTRLQPIWHHTKDAQYVLRCLATDAHSGLTLVDAEKRLLKYGPNILTPPRQTPWWIQILRYFTDFFSLLLQFAAVLCFLAFVMEPDEPMHLSLGIFLYLVVLATSLFAFFQQYKSDRTLHEFRSFLPTKAHVKRDGGAIFEIDASHLVVGDIVEVKRGDKIPADLRLLSSEKFTVDNSPLTGESEPIQLGPRMTSDNPLETANLAFFGCLAVDGACSAVVIATGDRTVFGEIARLTSSGNEGAGKTTLHHDIHHFVVNISVFAITVGILFFVTGLVKGVTLVRNLVYSIGIIVSNIPEGLLATVTVSLTASARRMARKKVLVKQLDAVETLGSTTVICSDKTGTLTQNSMSVSHIAHGGRVEAVHSTPLLSCDESNDGDARTSEECKEALLFGATVCSSAVSRDSTLPQNVQGSTSSSAIFGDATEAAILRFTEKIHCVNEVRARHERVATIPFNSNSKFMVTVHRCPESEYLLRVVAKGAPERILERCTDILAKEGCRAITKRDLMLLERQISYLASRGERVLAYAEKHLPPQQAALAFNEGESSPSADNIPTTNLCFVGLVSLMDPPRESVEEAVKRCKDAGIRVIMVTGDHRETARSIAQQIGIITMSIAGEDESMIEESSTGAVVVNGEEIREASEEKWRDVLSHREIVFARTSPQQKLEIVKHLQKAGEVVTVTGDGCNDAPALKQANTGVAMGTSGSDVSREAADIVLLDDNFSSILGAVEEGRLIFDNLKKSIAYTLASNVPQLVPFLAFIALQIPLPLTTVLILCIDLGTDIFPAISLAYEKPEHNIMRRPPRNAKEDHLMSRKLISFSTLQLGVIQSFSGFLAYFIIMSDYGLAPTALLGLNAMGHFGSERLVNQRWMYTSQQHVHGTGFEAGWFSKSNPRFAKYFATDMDGFIKQSEDRFSLLPDQKNPREENMSAAELNGYRQFLNMVKIIGYETKRPSCRAFTCSMDGGVLAKNDYSCFDPGYNSNPIQLLTGTTETVNNQVSKGRSPGQGCFSLWTPKREKEVLRHAQTGFFVAVVIAQIFALVACKNRILSSCQTGIMNFAMILAVTLELVVSVMLVYFPFLQTGFGVRPLRAAHWLPGIPFGLVILIYDECRKCFIRRHLLNESGLVVPGTGLTDKLAGWIHDYTLW